MRIGGVLYGAVARADFVDTVTTHDDRTRVSLGLARVPPPPPPSEAFPGAPDVRPQGGQAAPLGRAGAEETWSRPPHPSLPPYPTGGGGEGG